MRALTIISLLLLTAVPVIAQNRTALISGRVIDVSSGEGLSGVHVFIAASMHGTATDADGAFELGNVTPGVTRLMFSMMGFRTASVDTVLQVGQRIELEVSLAPAVIELQGMDVEAERPRRWASRLRQFERLFIGESAIARKSELLNAEVLDFSAGWGRLRAEADAPLVIENRGLGYRLTYHLRHFERSGGTVRWDGDPFFEELKPETDEERSRWPVARCETYFGSFRHLVLSLLQESAWDQGFRIGTRMSLNHMQRSMPFRVRESRIVREGPTEQERELRWSGFLEVEYVRQLEADEYLFWERRPHAQPATQRSWIRINSRPALVDLEGEVADPYAMTVYGYLAFNRIGDLLPKEYRPPDWVNHPRECRSILLAAN
jgi:hypothetical protein